MSILSRILSTTLGLFVADWLLDGVIIRPIPGKSIYFGIYLGQYWQILFFLGFILGTINAIAKPLLDFIALPLKVITFGLFSLLINMGILWLLDYFFLEIQIYGIFNLLITVAIISFSNFLFK